MDFSGREVVAVVFVQAGVGAEPEKTLLILNNVADVEIREALRDGQVVEADVVRLGKKRGGAEPEKLASAQNFLDDLTAGQIKSRDTDQEANGQYEQRVV